MTQKHFKREIVFHKEFFDGRSGPLPGNPTGVETCKKIGISKKLIDF